MNLNYRILWFEDAEDFVRDDIQPSLDAFLGEMGFSLTLDLKRTFVASEDFEFDSYDLIVTDLNLGGGNRLATAGAKIIAKVRKGSLLTDIVFYSTLPKQLKDTLDEGFLERVSVCYGRERLSEKVQAIIKLTIKKVHSVQNMRGLMISEAIDLDAKILDLLKHCKGLTRADWEAPSAERRTEMIAKVTGRIEGQLGQLKKFDETKNGPCWEQSFVGASDISKLLTGTVKDMLGRANTSVSTAGKKATAAQREHAAGLKAIHTELKAFEDEVIHVRNSLAHVKEEMDPATKQIVLRSRKTSGSPIVFDERWCAEQRKALRKHHENLTRCFDVLRPQ